MDSHALEAAASDYLNSGISVTATNKSKVSTAPWAELQTRLLRKEELPERFSGSSGVAIICGRVSGGIEVIDVDTKYDTTGKLYDTFLSMIPESLRKRLSVACTRSGGYHLYYRCTTIEGNQKLAKRGATAEELSDNPHAKVFVLLETRGEGGYVVAPPTEGYTWIQGDHKTIPTITDAERSSLHLAARSINEYLEEPQKEPRVSGSSGHGYAISPFEDYNERGDVIGLVTKHGWTRLYDRSGRTYFRRPGKDEGQSGDFWHEKRWFSVFTTSSQFEPNKAYKPAAVYCILECNGDWSECCRRLSGEGYGTAKKPMERVVERIIRDGKAQGLEEQDIIDTLIQKNGMSSAKAKTALKDYETNKGEVIRKFWDVKEQKDGSIKIVIIHDDFVRFLHEEGGFQLYFYDKNSKIYRLIRVKDGLVEDSSIEDIKKFIEGYIDGLKDSFDGISNRDLSQCIKRGHSAYFAQGLLEFLPRAVVDFMKDTPEAAYFPFENGLVKVTKDGVTIEPYGKKHKAIWKSQLIDFKINLIDIGPFKQGVGRCEFETFLSHINGGDTSRMEACATTIGYLLHKHKDPTRAYAVILAEETDDENSGGGTGKGIFVNALSKLLTVEQIDGKNFKVDKNFAFQRVGLDTRLLAIQDVRQKVDFEGYYSIITEGITVEKKGKDELHIPYADSPKVLFTTNYSIPAEGNHAKRRQKVIPFSGHYHPGHSPLDEFGHRLFDDWQPHEWNAFYNFMFACCQAYLEAGVKDIPITEGMKLKQIKIQYGEEFRAWFEHYTANGCNNWTPLKELHGQFIGEYGMDEKYFGLKRMKKAIEGSATLLGYSFEAEINRSIGNTIAIRVDVVDVGE